MHTCNHVVNNNYYHKTNKITRYLKDLLHETNCVLGMHCRRASKNIVLSIEIRDLIRRRQWNIIDQQII